MYKDNPGNSYYVYMHVFPNNKVYVGITSKEPEKRWLKDGYGYKNQVRVYRAINKYGWDNIEHIVIARNVNIETAQNMEIELIELYSSTDKKHGYNSDLGGYLHSKETRDKIAKARIGMRHTEETCKKMSLSRKGKPKSEEHKRKIGEAHKGMKMSEDFCRKMSEIAKNRHYDTDKNPLNISVLQYDIQTGKLVDEYLSISKAARETGLSKSHISECAKDNRRQEGGCVWIYKNMATDEYIRHRIEKARFHSLYKPVVVYSIDKLNPPMYFESTVKAADYLGISESAIRTYIGNERNGYYVQRISVDEYLNNI